MSVDWVVAIASIVLLLAITAYILVLTERGRREEGQRKRPERPDAERDASDEEEPRAA